MFFSKIVKVALIALTSVLLFHPISHSNLTQSVFYSSLPNASYFSAEHSSAVKQDSRIQRDSPKLIEDQMEDIMLHSQYDENQEVIQGILKDKKKLRKMAESCLEVKGSTNGQINVYGGVSTPIYLGSEIYLILMKCTTAGRSANDVRFFTYTESQGVNIQPLKLTLVSTNQFGKLSFQVTKRLLAKSVLYDPNKKELSISIGCNRADGRISSLTKYNYRQKRFVFSEFWQDDVSNKECIKEINLKQLYPSLTQNDFRD